MDINRPDVLAEATARFLDYERAINENDIRALDDAFLDSPHTVRLGMTEELWSHDEIKAFRRARNPVGTRRELLKYVITTYGERLAVANALFRREGVPKLGRQSQTWAKLDGGYDAPQIPSLGRSLLPSQRGHQCNERAYGSWGEPPPQALCGPLRNFRRATIAA